MEKVRSNMKNQMNEIQHGFLTTFGLLIPKTESVLLEHIFSQNTMLFIFFLLLRTIGNVKKPCVLT